jgi:hypothetical protein
LIMPSQKGRRFAAALAHRAGPAPAAIQIADGVIAVWRDIDRVLTPIVGTRGVAALRGRSLFLTARAHPWLLPGPSGIQATMDLGTLRSALALRSAEDALVGGVALLETFHDLLASMVGPALAEQLLRSIWDTPSSGDPAQDITS